MDEIPPETRSTTYLERLRFVLNQKINRQTLDIYFLLSKRFFDAIFDNNNIEDSMKILQGQYNRDLIQGWRGGSPVLKESLRQGRDYVVINDRGALLIKQLFKGIQLKRTRYLQTQRFLAYTKRIKYVLVQQKNLSEERELQVLELQVMPDITCPAISDILREKWFPSRAYPSYNHILWLCKSNPTTYNQIATNSVLFDTRTLLDNQRLVKILRRLKEPLFLFEVFEGTSPNIVAPQRKCSNCQTKQAQYFCLCLNEKGFACSTQCWLEPTKHRRRCIFIPHDDVDTTIQERNTTKGRTYYGLTNEENMCFFNTAIQCLVRAKPLTDYFFAAQQLKDRNYWCREGTFGSVALHYGQFIRNLLKKQEIIDQEELKNVHLELFNCVSRWNHQYGNRGQQDAHEFIIKLLEWLKQDLNRNEDIPKYKPLDQTIPNSQILKERKANLKRRNDSIIEDNFQWIMRSIITCLSCQTKSTSYDSMLTLQLPIVDKPNLYAHIIKQKEEIQTFFMETPLNQILAIRILIQSDDSVEHIKRMILQSRKIFNYIEYGVYVVTKNNGYREVKIGSDMMKLDENSTVFCLHKYAMGYKMSITEIKLEIEEEHIEKPGEYIKGLYFQRPIFILKKITGQDLHINVLRYFWKRISEREADKKRTANEFFALQHEKRKDFPFRLYKKTEKQVINQNGEKSLEFQEEAIAIDKDSNQVTFDEKSSLVMKVKQQKYISIGKILHCADAGIGVRGAEVKIQNRRDPAIEDCINAFCKTEVINNQWNCPRCKEIKSVSKSISFIELPRILIISLNRFKRDHDTGIYQKNIKKILYEEYLDFAPFLKGQAKSQPSRYRLFAVANHITLSKSISGGHYTAYVRDYEEWKKINDEVVLQIDLCNVLNRQKAYILFYERVD